MESDLFAESFNATGSGPKKSVVLVEEMKTASVQQNEHHHGREQELPGNVHKDNHIRTCRKRHCASRLLNVLFSDKFAEDFASLGMS